MKVFKMSTTPEHTNDLPWYREGLRFSCHQCGNCCTGSAGYVWVSEEDIKAIAVYLDKPVGEIRLLNTRKAQGKISLTEYPNGDCVYFDPIKRQCRIYPVRPAQCRTWPFWGKHLTRQEDWNNLKPECQGIDKGKLYTLEEIKEQEEQSGL